MTNFVAVLGGRKDKRDIANKVVHWCIKEMMPRMRTLEIVVNLKDLKGAAYGYCMEGDNNREFDVEIDKNLSLFDFVATICHEMVHVKQYARRELRYDAYGNTMWKKGRYNTVDYENAPWEKEAFKMERGLALKCFEEVL
jgi:hypothetical protein